MKTTKKLVVICFSLIMAIAAVMPSTFSWYNHSGALIGKAMKYERNDLPVSSGTITISTKKFETQDNKLKYDLKGNKSYDGGSITSDSVAASSAHYYGTTITNSSTAEAYVNLYLSGYTNATTNLLGTISPSLTEKGLTASTHIKNYGVVRVYFQWSSARGWNKDEAKSYVVCTKKGSATTERHEILKNDDHKIIVSDATTVDKNYYWVDLPAGTTSFYFASDIDNPDNVSDTGAVTKHWCRTNDITNISAEKAYYLTGNTDDISFRAEYASFDLPGGISVNSYYDTVNINKDQSAYVSLKKGINFTGKSVAYTTADTGFISVNATTGYLTSGTAIGSSATKTITTTITGEYGDTISLTTDVTNPSSLDAVPISENILVPAKSTNSEGDEVPGKIEVVWYIKNNAASGSTAFTNIYYTK